MESTLKYTCLLLACGSSFVLFNGYGLAQSGSGVIERLDSLEKELKLFENAVVAFESEACPDGWVPYTAASGRTIIGAGIGMGLKARILHDSGGTETHRLTPSEMPEHSHEIEGMTHYSYDTTKIPRTHTNLYTKNNNFQFKGMTLSTGSSAPHNNLPPYYVLTFCKKFERA